MDRYTAAARQYILSSFSEHGEPLDSKKLHVHFVDTWRGYRLYSMNIDGRYVEPRFPPLYIIVDKDTNVRWMTEDEGDEYQNDMDRCLRKAVMWMEHQMRNEQS